MLPFQRSAYQVVAALERSPTFLTATMDHRYGLPQVFVGAMEFLSCLCSPEPQVPHQICVSQEDVSEAKFQRRNDSS